MTFKQVEYLVYWIHQMELVPNKEHIPIPSSKSLLFEEDLEEIVSQIPSRLPHRSKRTKSELMRPTLQSRFVVLLVDPTRLLRPDLDQTSSEQAEPGLRSTEGWF